MVDKIIDTQAGGIFDVGHEGTFQKIRQDGWVELKFDNSVSAIVFPGDIMSSITRIGIVCYISFSCSIA